MAFSCTLDPESVSAHVILEENRALANIPIGIDLHADKSYSLFVTLGPQAGGEYELTFCVIEYDGENDAATDIWDSLTVAKIIPAEDRRKILRCLLGALSHLIDAVRPSKVFMCTLETEVDPRMSRKYLLIARTFEKCGYVVRCADEYHGQQAWWMERD